jgi:hypothetical protein
LTASPCLSPNTNMAKHPNSFELRRIHLTQHILTLVALVMIVLIGLLAMRGNFKKTGMSPADVRQEQRSRGVNRPASQGT